MSFGWYALSILAFLTVLGVVCRDESAIDSPSLRTKGTNL